jgi:hypothetical protein
VGDIYGVPEVVVQDQSRDGPDGAASRVEPLGVLLW